MWIIESKIFYLNVTKLSSKRKKSQLSPVQFIPFHPCVNRQSSPIENCQSFDLPLKPAARTVCFQQLDLPFLLGIGSSVWAQVTLQLNPQIGIKQNSSIKSSNPTCDAFCLSVLFLCFLQLLFYLVFCSNHVWCYPFCRHHPLLLHFHVEWVQISPFPSAYDTCSPGRSAARRALFPTLRRDGGLVACSRSFGVRLEVEQLLSLANFFVNFKKKCSLKILFTIKMIKTETEKKI